jgi:hypothetical protein
MPETTVAPRGFEHHEDFPALMHGSRRRPSLLAPDTALTHYEVFWIPSHGNFVLHPDKWVVEIEQFLLELYRHLKQSGVNLRVPKRNVHKGADGSERLDLLNNSYLLRNGLPLAKGAWESAAPIKNHPSRYQTFSLAFEWEGLPVTLRLEILEESFALTRVIDLSQASPQGADQAAKLHKALSQLNQSAMGHYRREGQDERLLGEAERSQLAEAHQTLHYDVWDEFFKKVFAAPYEKARRNMGKVVADFRGLAVTRGRGGNFIAVPGASSHRVRTEGRDFDPGEAARCARAMAPYMRIDEPSLLAAEADTAALERREMTFTRFEEQYIYASGLGALPPELNEDGDAAPKAQEEHQPLTYMFLSSRGGNARRRGRHLASLHEMGSLRIAALKDLFWLAKASPELRQLEHELDSLERSRTTSEIALDKFAQDLNTIALQRDERGRDHIIGGLPQRVEDRSQRLYQAELRRVAIDLGPPGEIEGFTSYGNAVDRRLAGTFNFINMLGDRFKRMRRRLDDLYQRLQTDEVAKEQRRGNRIQKVLEAFGFGVVLPYNAAWYAMQYYGDEYLLKNPQVKYNILNFALGAGALLALYRTWGQRPEERFRLSAKQILEKSKAQWKTTKVTLLDPRVVSTLELAKGPFPEPS